MMDRGPNATMRLIAEMDKVELQTFRAERIAELQAANTVGQREVIQADLSNINARLKQINTEEGRQAKIIADQRQAAGLAEQQANLRRASTKIPTSKPAKQPLSPKPSARTPVPQRSLTRGEFLWKHAKQMKKAIDSIRSERRLPHTTRFLQELEVFMLQQRRHLDDSSEASAPGTVVTDSEWKRTWTADAVEPGE